MDAEVLTLEDRLAAVAPDCGDNSCRFAWKRGGMRTNGGCRCIDERAMIKWSKVERYAAILAQEVPRLLRELEQLNTHCQHPGCGCVCNHKGLCPEDGPSLTSNIGD